MKDRGINLVANALAQSTDHILSFFNMLRTELAFYVGGLNLARAAQRRSGSRSLFRVPVAADKRSTAFRGLYDVCLALSMGKKVVGNDVEADGKDLVIITGANQGGKSTFLRSIGLAQLMLQCGMFVPAESFSANVCDGLFTHYKREEDTTMKSGKLDEELSRMSDIVDHLTPNAMVLFNESFAATNEREGSEIARQIVGALAGQAHQGLLRDASVRICARLLQQADEKRDVSAGRTASRRTRTFKLIEGEPLQTSYGEDLYKGIFGVEKGPGVTRAIRSATRPKYRL